jgi:hypothetical protein
MGALVIVHYATALQAYWEINPLMNCVLLMSPIALACQVRIWFHAPSKLWLLLNMAAAICVLFALGSEWIRWFSKNPYESYILLDHFFGPHGWHNWLWAITTGFLPLALAFRVARERDACRRILVVLILIGYLDNLIFVFRACHL